MTCKVCQGTKFHPTQPSPGQIVIGPCPECCEPPPSPIPQEQGEQGWHLRITVKKPNGVDLERPLISVSEDGKVTLHKSLGPDETMIVVDKSFIPGLIWQALVLVISECRRLQDKLQSMDDRLAKLEAILNIEDDS